MDEPTRHAIQTRVQHHAPQAAWIEIAHRPQHLLNVEGQTAALQQLRGQRVAAFAGIGNPQGFFHGLEQLGCQIVARRVYPDHFHYDDQDLAGLHDWARDAGPLDSLICTGKDLVKLRDTQLSGIPLWALAVEVQVLRGAELLDRLLREVCAQLLRGQSRS